MKRFQSPLQRLLRVRTQAERMSQIQVSHARSAVDAATSRLSASQAAAERQSDELTERLSRPCHPWTLTQSNGTFREQQVHVGLLTEEQAKSESLLDEALTAYRSARQQREMVERIVTQQREQHRRESLKAETVDLLDWSLRRTVDTTAAQPEETPHA